MRPSTFLVNKLTLSASGWGVMRLNHVIFPGEPRHRIARFDDEIGSFIFNEVITDDFDLCYGQVLASRNITLSITGNRQFLGILFNLGEVRQFSAQSFEPGTRRRGQYGLVYVPEISKVFVPGCGYKKGKAHRIFPGGPFHWQSDPKNA